MSKVIQFPGKKGSSSPQSDQPLSLSAAKGVEPQVNSSKQRRSQQLLLGGAVLSILLATMATNQSVFRSTPNQSLALSSVTPSSGKMNRDIASVPAFQRPSQWERSVADNLASADVRGPASFNIGREVTAEEKLHFGALNGIYSLEFSTDTHLLRKIVLQDQESNPTYLSSSEFFRDFGLLVNPRFKSALLVGVPSRFQDKIYENYRVFDIDNRPVSEATFERDRHGRLLSMEITALN